MKGWMLFFALAGVLLLTGAARAESPALPQLSPRVIATTPTMEQRRVPPGETVIQVRFDRPMNQTSWSWCGGGPRYPEVLGTPRFLDPFTVELPVVLEPERTYFLSINCPSARNFVSEDGVSAEPYPLHFTTGWSLDHPVVSDARNLASWNEFRQLFRERYSHYERTGTDWEAVFDEAKSWMLMAPDADEFAVRLALLLQPAEDVHLSVRLPDDSKVSFYRRSARYNANKQSIRAAFPHWNRHSRAVESGRSGRIGYLAIHSWSLSDEELAAIDEILADFRTATNVLILDVRGNGGGNELQARRVAGWFLDAARLYGRNRSRDPEADDGWSAVHTRWVQANAPEKRYEGRVFVLQGPVCLSSNEAFLLMMRQASKAVSVGENSGGSSGNPKRFPLANGLSIVLPSWQSLLPDGTPIEGIGIPPDVRVDGDFSTSDRVLEKALELAAPFLPGEGS
ncbi:MAG: hypothetical protein PWP23_2895 [Candidatus Sumerlaeota bacterium]|nr:hypothetical protein [Candidatus Sumerlaeota bacterium]